MNRFEQSAIHLGQRLQQAAGRAVTYVRNDGNDTDNYDLTIPMSAHEYEVVDNFGVVTMVTAYEWLIPVADLDITPAAGDRIMDGTTEYTLAPVAARPAVERLDAQGHVWRVRTKITAEE